MGLYLQKLLVNDTRNVDVRVQSQPAKLYIEYFDYLFRNRFVDVFVKLKIKLSITQFEHYQLIDRKPYFSRGNGLLKIEEYNTF